jgi:chromosomal replication initiator protein
VVGSSNQFAAAAAEAVAEQPGKAYNPLYIYGGSGLGKTHLLHAIANRLREPSSSSKVVYMTTEQFVNELINCIRRKQMDAFRQTFRGVDILLLDDIQFIAGKERTQEEFFHTFNTLQSTGRQVVFTSDARPADIPGLEERLRSRFLQGLIADIQPPDLETRCAILREKARAVGRELSEDVVLFISRRVQNNVRELEGCLNRTIAYAQLKNAKISIDVVRMALYELLPDERATSPSDIIRFVAQHYGIRVADLKGRSNRRSIALPRQVAMYLIRDILELSFPEIGRIFSKHHSTVMYAVDNVVKMRQSNPDFDATLTSFREHFV